MDTAQPDEPVLSLTTAARAESLTVVRQAISAIADVEGWDAVFVSDLKVAVSEACGNAVVHAYPQRGGDLHVDVWSTPETVRVQVRDDGVGMGEAVGESPGLGLGMPLMMSLTQRMQVASQPGGPTCVDMYFSPRRSEAASA